MPKQGDYQLRCRIADAQNAHPPALRIQVNGQAFERKTAGGTGDDSVHGEPGKGKAQEIAIPISADALVRGDNTIQITTVSGSWFLYDSVSLEGPALLELAKVRTGTVLERSKTVASVEAGGKQFDGASAGTAPSQRVARDWSPGNEGSRYPLMALNVGTQSSELLVPPVEKTETGS